MQQNRIIATIVVSSVPLLVALSFHASLHAAESTREYHPPRNEFDQADIQGVWNFSSNAPLERPAEFKDKEYLTREEAMWRANQREEQIDKFLGTGVGFHDKLWLDYNEHVENLRTSLITYPKNGLLPPFVEGVQRIRGSLLEDVTGTYPVRFFAGGIGKDNPEDRGLLERCIANDIGPPIRPGGESNYLQIFQTRDHVVLLFEQIHDARIIALNKASQQSLRSWFGHSLGHWEGDTLVIETENFNGLTPSFDDTGSSYHKRVIERFTRVSENVLQYSATLLDANTFRDRIELAFPMAKVEHRLFEYACHEGNYSMAFMLSGNAEREKKEVDTEEVDTSVSQ